MRLFLHGLCAAVIGGAFSSALDAIQHGNTTPKGLIGPAATGAVLGFTAYFAKSPLTPPQGTDKKEP